MVFESKKTSHNPKKKDSSHSVVPKKNKLYLSSTATESKKMKKKLSESSQLEKSPS